MANIFVQAWTSFYGSLNFFRIHVLFFVFTPLICSAIFYAANGMYPVSYIDALFNCVSAITVTGLATVDLSQLTGFQQALLFVQMCVGNPVIVSWVIVYVRRRFFRTELSHIIAEELKRERQGGIIASMRERTTSITRSFSRESDKHPPGFLRRLALRFRSAATPGGSLSGTASGTATPASTDGMSKRKGGLAQRLRTDMIRRTEEEPQRVDPMGRRTEVGPMDLVLPNEKEPDTDGDMHLVTTGSSRTRYEPNEYLSPDDVERIGLERNGTIITPPPDTDLLSPGFGGMPVESPKAIDDRASADDQVIEDDVTSQVPSTGPNGYPNPRAPSPGRSVTDTDALSTQRVSQSPVRFRPPPVRVTPGVRGDDNLSPNALVFGHERQQSENPEFPRTQTIEFAHAPQLRGRTGTRRQSAGVASQNERERMRLRSFAMGGVGSPGSDAGDTSLGGAGSQGHGRARAGSTGRQRMGSVSTAYFPRTATGRSYGTTRMNAPIPSKESGFGGYPMPHELAGRAIRRFLPSTMTLPRTLTGASANGAPPRSVPYISFDAIVGRNSQFHDLSQEEQEELGGVEYRALTALLWIVGGYHLGTQLLAFVIIAPYSSMRRWAPVFSELQHRFVPPTWFAAFQVVSAYTNAGMSLVDQSMVPFQTAYPMIITLFVIILAGNTAFPIFLRFVIWLMSKVVGRRTHETLSFLLDHPRRCFIYLFPSHQTWFLFVLLLTMIITDWVSFMVLDIGNEVVEAVPVGTRLAIGFLQASAVRAAGFATISLSALAPAVKVLYVTMMYVAVYPIAISVRSTNVYEERSLGIYEEQKHEEEPNPSGGPINAWGNYLAWHARRQLSFDMWWLAFALWIVCILERGEIVNPDNAWFDIFAIIFELTSAYGTVGLSLGIPTANYSFSGALRPLSKLVVIIVMLRGRHRGLPHAIDRAVVLPRELKPDRASQGSNSGLDLPGNRQSVVGTDQLENTGAGTGRIQTNVDLKHRTNTFLSPVHEVLTPVTSNTGTPRPTTFGAMG